MSTSGIRCTACGAELATKTSSNAVRVVAGVLVRLRRHSAELTCPCGHVHVEPYPREKAA